MKPYTHAMSSARRFGGTAEDYLDIHEFMDSSKAAMADNRHRALTHNAWFLQNVLLRVFGSVRTNSAGRAYSVASVGEQHVLEDFGGYIPSAQDYLQEIEFKPWMQNGRGVPASCSKLAPKPKETKHVRDDQCQGSGDGTPAERTGEVSPGVFCG